LTVAGRGWIYVRERAGRKPPPAERIAIAAACDRFIAEVLKPRFLPEIRPNDFNYPIAIYGKWHGSKYRFMTRYRSDDPRSYQSEFEAPFARLAYIDRDRFDLSWHRHTGAWFCLFEDRSLKEALHLIESDGHFQPC
jgi:hypothetical protein